MSKLLPKFRLPPRQRRERAAKRFSFRRWLALYLQERRRRRASTPPEPQLSPALLTIYEGYWFWNGQDPSKIDVGINWTGDYKGEPVAQVEVWCFGALIATVDDEGEFLHVQATDSEVDLPYKVRYRRGEVVGAFSPEYVVSIAF